MLTGNFLEELFKQTIEILKTDNDIEKTDSPPIYLNCIIPKQNLIFFPKKSILCIFLL